MRNIWFHGFKVMCILCTRLTGMTKLVGDVMGKLLDFTEKAIFLFVGAKLTVTDCCDIMRNCYICFI